MPNRDQMTLSFDPSELQEFDSSQLTEASAPKQPQVQSFDPSQLQEFDPSQLSESSPAPTRAEMEANAPGVPKFVPKALNGQESKSTGPNPVAALGIPDIGEADIPEAKRVFTGEAYEDIVPHPGADASTAQKFLWGAGKGLAQAVSPESALEMAALGVAGKAIPALANAPKIAEYLKDLPTVAKALDVMSHAALPAALTAQGAKGLYEQGMPKNAEQAGEAAVNALMLGLGAHGAIEAARSVMGQYPSGKTAGTAEVGAAKPADRATASTAIDAQQAQANAESLAGHGSRLAAEQWAAQAEKTAARLWPEVYGNGAPVDYQGKPATVRLSAEKTKSGRPIFELVDDATGNVIHKDQAKSFAEFMRQSGQPAGEPTEAAAEAAAPAPAPGPAREFNPADLTEAPAAQPPQAQPQGFDKDAEFEGKNGKFTVLENNSGRIKFQKRSGDRTFTGRADNEDQFRSILTKAGVQLPEVSTPAQPVPEAAAPVAPSTPVPPPSTPAVPVAPVATGTPAPPAQTPTLAGTVQPSVVDQQKQAEQALTTGTKPGSAAIPGANAGPVKMPAPAAPTVAPPQANGNPTESPAPPAPSPSTTGLGELGGAAQGISQNMRDMLWDKVQQGDVNEAGAPSPILQIAKFAREAGGLQTRGQFDQLTQEYGKTLGLPKEQRSPAFIDLARKYAGMPAAGPKEEAPATSNAKPVSGIADLLGGATRPVKIGGETQVHPDPIAQQIANRINATPGATEQIDALMQEQGAGSPQIIPGGFDHAVVDLGNGKVMRLGPLPSHEAESDLIAKPMAQGVIGGVGVGIYPKLDTHGITDADVKRVTEKLAEHGLQWNDAGTDNLARDANGDLKIIDGNVRHVAEASAKAEGSKPERYLSPDSVGLVTVQDGPIKGLFPKSPLAAEDFRRQADPVLDLNRRPTGWLEIKGDNGTTLIHPDDDRFVTFTANDRSSGSDVLRAKAEAQAYAIDHPVKAAKTAEPVATSPVAAPKQEPATEPAQPAEQENTGPEKPANKLDIPPIAGRSDIEDPDLIQKFHAWMVSHPEAVRVSQGGGRWYVKAPDGSEVDVGEYRRHPQDQYVKPQWSAREDWPNMTRRIAMIVGWGGPPRNGGGPGTGYMGSTMPKAKLAKSIKAIIGKWQPPEGYKAPYEALRRQEEEDRKAHPLPVHESDDEEAAESRVANAEKPAAEVSHEFKPGDDVKTAKGTRAKVIAVDGDKITIEREGKSGKAIQKKVGPDDIEPAFAVAEQAEAAQGPDQENYGEARSPSELAELPAGYYKADDTVGMGAGFKGKILSIDGDKAVVKGRVDIGNGRPGEITEKAVSLSQIHHKPNASNATDVMARAVSVIRRLTGEGDPDAVPVDSIHGPIFDMSAAAHALDIKGIPVSIQHGTNAQVRAWADRYAAAAGLPTDPGPENGGAPAESRHEDQPYGVAPEIQADSTYNTPENNETQEQRQSLWDEAWKEIERNAEWSRAAIAKLDKLKSEPEPKNAKTAKKRENEIKDYERAIPRTLQEIAGKASELMDAFGHKAVDAVLGKMDVPAAREATTNAEPVAESPRAVKDEQTGQESIPETQEARKPWQMTRAEFMRQKAAEKEAKGSLGVQPFEGARIVNGETIGEHQKYVREALAAGEKVSGHVLNDYPHLREGGEKQAAPNESEKPETSQAGPAETKAEESKSERGVLETKEKVNAPSIEALKKIGATKGKGGVWTIENTPENRAKLDIIRQRHGLKWRERGNTGPVIDQIISPGARFKKGDRVMYQDTDGSFHEGYVHGVNGWSVLISNKLDSHAAVGYNHRFVSEIPETTKSEKKPVTPQAEPEAPAKQEERPAATSEQQIQAARDYVAEMEPSVNKDYAASYLDWMLGTRGNRPEVGPGTPYRKLGSGPAANIVAALEKRIGGPKVVRNPVATPQVSWGDVAKEQANHSKLLGIGAELLDEAFDKAEPAITNAVKNSPENAHLEIEKLQKVLADVQQYRDKATSAPLAERDAFDFAVKAAKDLIARAEKELAEKKETKPEPKAETPAPTKFFHATSAENAASIRKEGFRPSTDGELGPGVYVIADPSELTDKRFAGMTQLPVESSAKLLTIGSGPNKALEFLRALYGRDQGTGVYESLNRNRTLYKDGHIDWVNLQRLAKEKGYGGAVLDGGGAKNTVIFDAKDVQVHPEGKAETPAPAAKPVPKFVDFKDGDPLPQPGDEVIFTTMGGKLDAGRVESVDSRGRIGGSLLSVKSIDVHKGQIVGVKVAHLKRIKRASAPEETKPAQPETQRAGQPQAKEDEAEEKHDYSSTQVDLRGDEAGAIKAFGQKIPDADLAEDGREDKPHVTVLYGLTAEDPTSAAKKIEKFVPLSAKFGKTSLFRNDDADVLKVDVESPGLKKLNQSLAKLPNENTHPEYIPHVTIAYLKPGTGDKYAGKDVPGLTGKSIRFHQVTFSSKNGEKTDVALKGEESPEKPTDLAGAAGMSADDIIAAATKALEAKRGPAKKAEAPKSETPKETPKGSFKYELKVHGEGDKWHQVAVAFPTEDEAEKAGLFKFSNWMMATDYRVVPSDETPNYNWDDENRTIKAISSTEARAEEPKPEAPKEEPRAETKQEQAEQPKSERKNPLRDAANAARERLRNKARGGQANSGIDPQDLVDLATIGAEHIIDGAYKFADWARKVTEDVGDLVDSFAEATKQPREAILRQIHEYARKVAKNFDVEAEETPKGGTHPEETEAVAQGADPEDISREASPSADAKAEGDEPGHVRLANAILRRLQDGREIGNNVAFQKFADQAFGGSRAQGKYEMKEAYDALEAAVNRYIADSAGPNLLSADPKYALSQIRQLLGKLPTQNVRSEQQELLQQFSTPPSEAFVVAKVAGIRDTDVVLEPSAGTGGLASWAKAAGAIVHGNEIDPRRRELLAYAVRGTEPTGANAEILNATLPPDIRPTVVIMNPPFSATGGRVKSNKNKFGYRHVTEALKRLQPGGRLVAILGEGSHPKAPSAREFWAEIGKQGGTIRANIGIDGREYAKYGTTFGNRIIVVDKVPAADIVGQTGKPVTMVTGDFTTLEDAYDAIREIAANRPIATAKGGGSLVQADGNLRGAAGEKQPGNRSGSGESVAPGAGQVDNGTGENGSGAGGVGVPGQEPSSRPEKAEPGRPDENRDGDAGDSGGSAVTPLRPEDRVSLESRKKEDLLERKEDDSSYVEYVPSIEGLAHPGRLVETKVMASVSGPSITYSPNIPKNVDAPKPLSAAQMETIGRAGMMHQQIAPDGRRLGFLLGDGTGVGKGQQLAGIIWDRNNSGQKRALWVSASKDLMNDAARDFNGIGATDLAEKLRSINDWNPASEIDHKEGVIFSTYQSLIAKAKGEKGKTRLEQIKNWLGPNGVIVFDEGHRAKNAVGGEGRNANPSQTGESVLKLQTDLPKAYVVYASATSATDVNNLGYMDRLGLWGEGTPFHQGFGHFMGEIGRGGVAAMELISRELKALGRYLSRSISYRGVAFEEKTHEMTAEQRETYDTAAKAWQAVLEAGKQQLIDNNAQGSRGVGDFYQRFWGTHQRFFRKLLTAMKVPTILDLTDKALDGDPKNPKSVVISLIGTGAAQQDRAIASGATEDDDDLDFSPKESLISMIRDSYPTILYEEYEDDQGNVRKRPVTDEKGNPVENPEAVATREALIKEIDDNLALPENPLDFIIRHYGRENVAEMTSRKKTLERNPDTGKWQNVSRAPEGVAMNKINEYEMGMFQSGQKRIAIISKAAGTGISLHADRAAKNQQPRFQIVMELSWSADDQMQSFGRTHRTNQAQPPEYAIVSTDAGGEKRFSSTIARRLESLGALTKGQRDASGGGSVLAKYNFETAQGEQATSAFYDHLLNDNPEIAPGLTGHEALEQMGILKRTSKGIPFIDKGDKVNTTRLLNRILNIKIGQQNAVFEYFTSIFDSMVQRAIENGTLDTGVNLVRGDHINLAEERPIAKDPSSGATTYRYVVEVERKNKPVPSSVVEDLINKDRGKIYKRREFKGATEPDQLIWAEKSRVSITNRNGTVETAYNAFGPGHREAERSYERIPESEFKENWEPIEGENSVQRLKEIPKEIKDAEKSLESSTERGSSYRVTYYTEQIQKLKAEQKRLVKEVADLKNGQFDMWQQAYDAAPKSRKERIDMIGGSVLRVWPYLNVGSGRMDIRIAYPDAGGSITGVVMSEGDANRVEQALTGQSVARSTDSIFDAAIRGKERFKLAGGVQLVQNRVNREPVIEVKTNDYNTQSFLRDIGVKSERLGYSWRHYIPSDAKVGVPILEKLLKQYPVTEEGAQRPESASPAARGRRNGRFGSESGSAPMLMDLAQAIVNRFGKADAPLANYSGLGALERRFMPGGNLAQTERADTKVAEAMRQYASHRSHAAAVVRWTTPKIEKSLEGSGVAYEELRRYYSDSRLQGIRQRWFDLADQADSLEDDQWAHAYNDHFAGFLSSIENKRGLPQDLAQTAAALLEQKNYADLKELLSTTFMDAGSMVAEIMDPERFDEIHDMVRNDPRVREADRLYGEHVEKPMSEAHAIHEGVFSDARGPANRYIPLVGMTEEEQPKGFFGAGKPYRKPENEHNRMATGISEHGYDTSIHAFVDAMGNAIRRSDKFNALKIAEKAGLWREFNGAVPETYEYRGVEYKPDTFDITEPKILIQNGKAIRVAGKKAVAPDWFVREIKPIMESDKPADQNWIQRFIEKDNSAALVGPALFMIDSANIFGTLAANTPFLGTSLLDKAASAPILKRITAMVYAMRTVPSGAEAADDILDMAKAGALPAKYAKKTWNRKVAEQTGANLANWWDMTPALYGPNGLDVRARLLLWRIAKAANPSATPTQLHHFVNQIGTYIPGLQSDVERMLKKTGLAPFVTRGQQMIVNGLNAVFGTGPMPKSGRDSLNFRIWQQITGGALGLLVLWALLHKHQTGKDPWDDERAKFGYIPLTPEQRNSPIGKALCGTKSGTCYVPLSFFNPIVMRGLRASGAPAAFDAAVEHGAPWQVAEAGATQAINTFAQPAVGPAVHQAFILGFGKEPYLTSMRDRSGYSGPQLFPVVPPKEHGTKMMLDRGKAALLGSNAMLNSVGESTGFLGPDAGKAQQQPAWWARMIMDMAVGSHPTVSNPHAKAEMLRQQRTGTR